MPNSLMALLGVLAVTALVVWIAATARSFQATVDRMTIVMGVLLGGFVVSVVVAGVIG